MFPRLLSPSLVDIRHVVYIGRHVVHIGKHVVQRERLSICLSRLMPGGPQFEVTVGLSATTFLTQKTSAPPNFSVFSVRLGTFLRPTELRLPPSSNPLPPLRPLPSTCVPTMTRATKMMLICNKFLFFSMSFVCSRLCAHIYLRS